MAWFDNAFWQKFVNGAAENAKSVPPPKQGGNTSIPAGQRSAPSSMGIPMARMPTIGTTAPITADAPGAVNLPVPSAGNPAVQSTAPRMETPKLTIPGSTNLPQPGEVPVTPAGGSRNIWNFGSNSTGTPMYRTMGDVHFADHTELNRNGPSLFHPLPPTSAPISRATLSGWTHNFPGFRMPDFARAGIRDIFRRTRPEGSVPATPAKG